MLAKAVRRCLHLQVLDLERNDLGAEGSAGLVGEIPNLIWLRELNLGRTDLMDEGVDRIRSLRTLPHLSVRNAVTDTDT